MCSEWEDWKRRGHESHWEEFWTLAYLDDPRSLMKLAANPYLLTQMVVIYSEQQQLPESRIALFTEFVEDLIYREKQAKPENHYPKAHEEPCEYYVAPFDVRLPHHDEADDQIDTTVQPDLTVICDKSKLDDKGCRGASDWTIEVLSPSTTLRDMETKRKLYECHAVREYWIIHPLDRWVMVYTLDERGRYSAPAVHGMDSPTRVQLFPDLGIDWSFMQEA